MLKKIPQKVIQNAVGLAIFTTMRTGLWISGAGGSGVLIARKEDGTWSPPSGILLHTAGLGFLVGVDIYDCVVVINNRKALESFTKIRATLGGEISAVAGPVGVGGVLEHDGMYKQANRPVFTYLKSRGFYAGVQVDGTVIIERNDENERFYGEKIGVADILAGKARHPPYEIKMLMETVKAAEGRTDVDQSLLEELEDQPAPGDVDIESNRSTSPGPLFGVPEPDDPDPFGVLALEQAGLEIREAGTGSRPISTQFEFHPSPTSPLFSKFNRRSMDTLATSNRGSYMSTRTMTSVERSTHTMEMGTQTDPDFGTPERSPSLNNGHHRIVEEEVLVKEPEEIDYTKIDLGPYSNLNHSASQEFDGSGTTATERSRDSDIQLHDNHGHDTKSVRESDDDTDHHSEFDDEEEPVVFEVAAVQQARPAAALAPQAINLNARGSIVDIPKRIPPPLPPRNARRTVDQASGRSPSASPTKDGFESVNLDGPTRVASYYDSPAHMSEKLMTDETLTPESEPRHSLHVPAAETIQVPVIDIIEDREPAAHAPVEEVHDLEKVKTAEYKPVVSAAKDESESEIFHSLPTTPMEVKST